MVEPSSRTPSKNQHRVLQVIIGLQKRDGTSEPISYTVAQALPFVAPDPMSRNTLLSTLLAVAKNGWLSTRVIEPRQITERGDNLAWSITRAGLEAFQRADSALFPTKEKTMDTATADPALETQHDEDEATNADLEELDGGEGEIVEDAEDEDVAVNEGASQLTLAIGGPKPVESLLKIRAKQIKFGTQRQFKNGDRIKVTGYIEIRKVAGAMQKNGKVHREQEAILSEITIAD